MKSSSFALRPISVAEADAFRRQGGDIHVADTQPGYPCRQCLRDADVGGLLTRKK